MRTEKQGENLTIFLAGDIDAQNATEVQREILCVDPIAAMFNGVCNESANITTTLLLAKENNMLDEEKYFA